MRVLVTGGFGWTAHAILEAFQAAGHETVAFDLPDAKRRRHVIELASAIFTGSVADFDAISRAMVRADAVVHLAVAVGGSDYMGADVPFSSNVLGTYQVFEAARQHRISKVVMMSEASVQVPNAPGEIVHATDLLKTSTSTPAEHLYDLTKRLQEDIARDFATAYNMSVVVLRAGHIVDGRADVDPHGRLLEEVHYLRGGWVCRYDLANAVVKALALEQPGYYAYHVIGAAAARQTYEIERTERELGLTIETRFEEYR